MEFFVLDLRRSAFNDEGYYSFDPVDPVNLGELPKCPHCQTVLGPKPWLPPFKIKVKGKRPGDICSSGYGRKLLISERLVNVCQERKVSGFLFHEDPVEVVRGWPSASVSYSLAQPVNTLTHLMENESGLKVHKMIGCNECKVSQRTAIERIRIDESTWDGEDVFSPSGLYGVVLVTSRFSEILEENSISNLHLVHQDDYSEQKSY